MARVVTPAAAPEREPLTTDVRWACPWCPSGAVETVPDDEVHAALGRARLAFGLHVGAAHPEHRSEIA